MEEKKIKGKDFLMIMLIACLTSLSIAYATISTTLTITNDLTVKAHDWDIHFENLEQENITGSNSTQIVSPAAIETDTTKISGLSVKFKKPGDSVSYTFDVKNGGGIDAKVSTISIGTPSCGLQTTLCNDIVYTLKYANGDSIGVDDELNAGQSRKLKLTISYKASSTQIVTEDVNVTGLDSMIVYSQK